VECYRTRVLHYDLPLALIRARTLSGWLLAVALLPSLGLCSGCSTAASHTRFDSGVASQAIATIAGAPSLATADPSSSPTVAMPPPLALTLGFTFPVDELSAAQANEVMAGRATRWTQVGGPDSPLRLLSWSDGRVTEVQSLDALSVPGAAGALALRQAVADQPGAVALLPWDGPRLRSKALKIDGRRPDDVGYPYRAQPQAVSASALVSDADGERGRFTLSAVGDLMLGRRVAQQALNGGAAYPLALAEPALKKGDLGIGNLEVSLTDRGQAVRKDYTFRAGPALAAGLAESGIGAVSLANNHVGDYGSTGVLDTVAALDAAGVAHAGAGADATRAAAATVVNVRGVRVALLSFANVPSDFVTGFSTAKEAATESAPGINWGTPETVSRAVVDAGAHADVVVVALHTGTEYADQPDSLQRSLAHAAIDAGAALVLGSHPHVLQGIEYYGGGVILYSLGNFVFDIDGEDVRTLGLPPSQTVVAQIAFQNGHVRGLELDPMVIDSSSFRPAPAAGPAARSVLDRVYRLTDALNPRQR
jgi:poly-gamma-glutamate capsule biosynthesis protein CapA/YwtB (metallophosphatase superfamily)